MRTDKRSLKLPLPGLSREDLERFRFGDGQEVRVRLRRLRTLRSHLREPENPSLESEIAVAIDCLLADEILPAIAHLESAAGLTPEALREP